MKKILLLALLFVGISTTSYSQFAGKGGSEKSGSFFSRLRGNKSRKQMSHFGKQKKDPNIKNNGTSYRRDRKQEYTVDGDGFGTATQGKRRRKK
ncbi:MAG: hypothetical protein V4608_03935 [Bacteroidota bacterium]